ncbi:MAG: four helix bundle protein [Candidatus Omnitrophota bacterium]
MPLRNFRDLKVWQMAKEIAVDTYRVTQQFPREEIYGLSSQMRRAAISISSNIAEGFNRFYKKDYRRFLMISLGSCGELESQIEVGTALGYVPENALKSLLEKLDHENRMLRKLHSAMDEKKRPEDSSPDLTAQKNSPSPNAHSDPFDY